MQVDHVDVCDRQVVRRVAEPAVQKDVAAEAPRHVAVALAALDGRPLAGLGVVDVELHGVVEVGAFAADDEHHGAEEERGVLEAGLGGGGLGSLRGFDPVPLTIPVLSQTCMRAVLPQVSCRETLAAFLPPKITIIPVAALCWHSAAE